MAEGEDANPKLHLLTKKSISTWMIQAIVLTTIQSSFDIPS